MTLDRPKAIAERLGDSCEYMDAGLSSQIGGEALFSAASAYNLNLLSNLSPPDFRIAETSSNTS
jgi:hypothetical protein